MLQLANLEKYAASMTISEHVLNVTEQIRDAICISTTPAAEDFGNARFEYGPKSTKYTDPFGHIMAPDLFGERFCWFARNKLVHKETQICFCAPKLKARSFHRCLFRLFIA